jgi:hypothetical protein
MLLVTSQPGGNVNSAPSIPNVPPAVASTVPEASRRSVGVTMSFASSTGPASGIAFVSPHPYSVICAPTGTIESSRIGRGVTVLMGSCKMIAATSCWQVRLLVSVYTDLAA